MTFTLTSPTLTNNAPCRSRTFTLTLADKTTRPNCIGRTRRRVPRALPSPATTRTRRPAPVSGIGTSSTCLAMRAASAKTPPQAACPPVRATPATTTATTTMAAPARHPATAHTATSSPFTLSTANTSTCPKTPLPPASALTSGHTAWAAPA